MAQFLTFMTLLCLSLAAAQHPTQCDALCLAKLGAAFEAKQHADNTFAFYEPPSNFSQTSEPGTLLQVEDVTLTLNYTVPSGLTMSRIIYTTSDINGTRLPTSAYILWPYVPPSPTAGYPLVAWAHGTSGVFRPCAPSNYRSLQYHFMVPYILALQGIAVVAPDYAGLGIDSLPSGGHFRHPWVTAPAQADDLANAIIAARGAFPALLPTQGPFVALGHSQGGRATWAFAERQATKPVAGYRGTVSLAPPPRFIDQIEQATQNPLALYANSTLSFQPLVIDAISTVFPEYNYSGLTPAARSVWFDAFAQVQGCLPTDVLAFSTLPLSNLTQPGWTKNALVQEWANISDVGNKKFKGPFWILIGEADAVVDVDIVESTVSQTCKLNKKEQWNESISFMKYSGVGHFPVIQAAQTTWLSWVKDRLGGQTINAGHCAKSTITGFRTQDTMQGSEPNFLVEWENPLEDYWKYTL